VDIGQAKYLPDIYQKKLIDFTTKTQKNKNTDEHFVHPLCKGN